MQFINIDAAPMHNNKISDPADMILLSYSTPTVTMPIMMKEANNTKKFIFVRDQ
jgi:hypothetical protein